MWSLKDSSIMYGGFECIILGPRPRVYCVEARASSILCGGLRTRVCCMEAKASGVICEGLRTRVYCMWRFKDSSVLYVEV